MLRALQRAAARAVAAQAAGPVAAGCVSHSLPSHPWHPAGMAPYSSTALAWLDNFVNYEKRGVPQAAGTDSDAGFDLVSRTDGMRALAAAWCSAAA